MAARAWRDRRKASLAPRCEGRIYFLECNPLPDLSPGWSDLVVIAEGAGINYRNLEGEILRGAIRRYKEQEQRKAVHADGDQAKGSAGLF